MFTKPCLILTTLAAMAFTPVAARAQDSDALLDLLVKKKIVTEKEAASLRSDLAKQESAAVTPVTSSATKLKLSTPLTEIELYGDARVRYEVRNGETAAPDSINPAGDTYQRNRARYRLRIGLEGTLVDDWFFGLRLETNSNPRSTNITFGDDTSAGPGPFAKNSDTVNVGQAYFGYKGFPGLTLTAGKMPNPFVTSSIVWDGDINPEGLAEQYKYTLQLGGGLPATDAVAATDKDGETMVTETTVPAFVPTLALFANFGQFVYDDSNSENPVGPSPSGIPDTDAYLLGWQIGAKYTFRKDMSVQIAPTLYNYTGNGDTFNRQFSGDPTFAVVDPVSGLVTTTTPNQTGINSLLVLEVPAEFAFKIGKLPAKVFGDFAYNCEGGERARRRVTPRKGIKTWPIRSEPASAAPSTRETSA